MGARGGCWAWDGRRYRDSSDSDPLSLACAAVHLHDLAGASQLISVLRHRGRIRAHPTSTTRCPALLFFLANGGYSMAGRSNMLVSTPTPESTAGGTC